jgi:arabinofuranosyltransferase
MKTRWLLWLLLIAAAALRIVLAFHLVPDGLFDDGYVTFRYARNLAKGLGLVFNPGERVLGTTSPLFTFLLAAGARLFGSQYIEQLALTIGVLASLASIYFSERALTVAEVPEEVKWTFLSVLCFLGSFVTNATSGMETPLVLFLMSLSLYFYVQNRLLALSVTGGLLFLSRIDTGIWLLALGIAVLSAPKRCRPFELVRPFLVFLATVGAWLCFTWSYFGSVIPQSVVGKAVSHAAFVLPDRNYILTFLSAFVPALRFGVWGFLLVAVVFLILLPPTVDFFKKYPALRPMVFFFLLYVALFLASHAPLFSWYVMPPKWAFYLLAIYGLWFYASRLVSFFGLPLATLRIIPALGVAIFILGIVEVKRDVAAKIDYPSIAISDYVERNLRPGGSIFLEHIGLIGYKTDRYIFDYMGLVTPETTRLRKAYGPAWLPIAARKYNADLVLLYDSDLPVIESTRDPDALWFQSHYARVPYDPSPYLTVAVFLKNNPTESAQATSRH